MWFAVVLGMLVLVRHQRNLREAWAAAVAGSEAILHLATRIPPLAQMRKLAAWRDNDRLRSQGASILVNEGLRRSQSTNRTRSPF